MSLIFLLLYLDKQHDFLLKSMSWQCTSLRESLALCSSTEGLSSGDMCLGWWTGDMGPPRLHRNSILGETFMFRINSVIFFSVFVCQGVSSFGRPWVGADWVTQNVTCATSKGVHLEDSLPALKLPIHQQHPWCTICWQKPTWERNDASSSKWKNSCWICQGWRSGLYLQIHFLRASAIFVPSSNPETKEDSTSWTFPSSLVTLMQEPSSLESRKDGITLAD